MYWVLNRLSTASRASRPLSRPAAPAQEQAIQRVAMLRRISEGIIVQHPVLLAHELALPAQGQTELVPAITQIHHRLAGRDIGDRLILAPRIQQAVIAIPLVEDKDRRRTSRRPDNAPPIRSPGSRSRACCGKDPPLAAAASPARRHGFSQALSDIALDDLAIPGQRRRRLSPDLSTLPRSYSRPSLNAFSVSGRSWRLLAVVLPKVWVS